MAGVLGALQNRTAPQRAQGGGRGLRGLLRPSPCFLKRHGGPEKGGAGSTSPSEPVVKPGPGLTALTPAPERSRQISGAGQEIPSLRTGGPRPLRLTHRWTRTWAPTGSPSVASCLSLPGLPVHHQHQAGGTGVLATLRPLALHTMALFSRSHWKQCSSLRREGDSSRKTEWVCSASWWSWCFYICS